MATTKTTPKIHTAHNPNLLTHMSVRSAAHLFEPWFFEPAAHKQFPLDFQAKYDAAIEHVVATDKKRVVERTFGVIPIAPRLDFLLSSEVAFDVLAADKFGGMPDFRVEIATQMKDDTHEFSSFKNHPRSVDDLIGELWPIGPDGARMLFICQFILTPDKVTTFDYYMHEKKAYNYHVAPFDCGSSVSFNPIFGKRVQVFKSAGSMFDTPQMDTHVIFDTVFYQRNDTNLQIEDIRGDFLSEDTYIAAVKRVIAAKACSIPCRLITEQSLGMDLDIDTDYLEDSPQCNLDYKLSDALHGGKPFSYPYSGNSMHLFGKPRSQQTPQRYFDTKSITKPIRMSPFLHWHNAEADMDHQVYVSLTRGSQCAMWGKCDSSCT